jgi:hypothetical protein
MVFEHSAYEAPRGTTLAAGIYRYTIGEGVVLIRTGSYGFSRSNIGRHQRPVPADVLPLEAHWSRPDTSWAVTSTGAVLPLILVGADSLHWAAFEGRTADCAAIVRNGADPNGPTSWGYSPLDLAIIGGHDETAERLLELGAAASPGSDEWYRAVDLRRIRVVEALLNRGLPVNASDSSGNTMLHRAAAGAIAIAAVEGFFTRLDTPESRIRSGANTRLMKLLLERGADPNLRNRTTRTAYDLLTGLIDTMPRTPPRGPPGWMIWAHLNNRANRELEASQDTQAVRTAVLNTHLGELQAILKTRDERGAARPSGSPLGSSALLGQAHANLTVRCGPSTTRWLGSAAVAERDGRHLRS